ncbi:MAG: radical SAM protein [Planctomycetota bacterium]|jgi:MoaA/NifB/PqqE/SkfB family radical SAM enzyme
MSLTESLLRAAWPALMSNRFGRQLPGRLAPRLGPGFLAAVKKVNGERLARAEAKGDSVFRAYPGFITVAGTSRCNIRCEFCINQWDAAPDGSNRPHMKAEHVQQIVREVFPYIRKLALSVSGEPLYDPHFQLLLDEARRHGVFVEFTTNAMLVSRPGMLDRILDGVGRVNISMDGATKETFERLRGGAKFDKVCANVKALTDGRKQRGQPTPEYNLRYILMKDSIHELPRMVELTHELGVDHLYTNHLQVFMDELKDQSLVYHRELCNDMLDAARQRAAELGQVVVLPDNFDLSEPLPEEAAPGEQPQTFEAATDDAGREAATRAQGGPVDGEAGGHGAAAEGRGAPERPARPSEIPPEAYSGRCPYLWDQAFFEADGSIFPCCNSGGVALGHMDKAADFWEIWTSPAYAKMRADVYSPRCHDICVNCYLREGLAASEAYVRPVEGAAVGGW